MEFHYLFKGILIGLSVSAPMGPMGAMVIQRTIHKGLPSGLASGGGVAMGDTIYALIAGFGLTFISGFLDTHQFYFRLIGGLILLFMGYKMYNPSQIQLIKEKRHKHNNLFTDFLSLLLLTVSNPFTVLIFGAAFAGLNVFSTTQNMTTLVVSGIFLGALIWWLILGFLIDTLKAKLNIKFIMVINKITGILVILVGLIALFSVFSLD